MSSRDYPPVKYLLFPVIFYSTICSSTTVCFDIKWYQSPHNDHQSVEMNRSDAITRSEFDELKIVIMAKAQEVTALIKHFPAAQANPASTS
ncbi:hypothetical protein ZOSMA_130G00060 [Zostera marina]|uniref:Uncharacterized protein n=1 Tax=Zostera marina TaxID=29655 RepID=A0A0K9Q1B9_ZOSMR|nr:hypothetical protein ZOSMA_130G00060 [Zostera marina]